MKLSGPVAIIRDGVVVATKDLGSEAIEISSTTEGDKDNSEYAVPLVEQRPTLKADEQDVFDRYEIGTDRVTAIYRAEPIPAEPQSADDRFAKIEARLDALEEKK